MKKHLLSVASLIFLVVICYWNWYSKLNLLSWGDFHPSFLETVNEYLAFPTIWQSGNLFGSTFVTLSFWPQLFIVGVLSHMNISSGIMERIIYFWPMTLLSVVSMYSLSYYIFKSRTAAFVSAIAYSFNAGTLSLGMGGIVTEAMAISLLPFLMLCFILILEKRKMLYVLLAVLLAFTIGFYEFRIIYLFSWILFFYLPYFFFVEGHVKKRTFFHILLLVSVLGGIEILLNFYWLLGLLNIGAITHNEIFATVLFGQQFVNIATAITNFPYFWTGAKTGVFTLEPILWYFWLIPLFAFLGLLYVKRNKKVLFFAFLALLGVFLVKQDASPFPNIYTWLFAHFPGFNAFRYSTVFGIYTEFAYAILIGGFICFLSQSARTMKRKIIFYAATFTILSVFLINIKPLVTKEIGELSIGRTIPKEYITLKDILYNDKFFYRTLSVPYAERFTFYNNTHPTAGFVSLPGTLQSLNHKLLNLESIRYVILPSDPIKDVYTDTSRIAFEDLINNSRQNNLSIASSIEPLASIGEIKLWENPNFNPHITPINDLVYVSGGASMKDIINLPTSDKVAYYLEENTVGKKNYVVKNTAFLNGATKMYVVADCARCDIENQYYALINFPYARFLPDSPLYPLIQNKENKTLSAFVDPQAKIHQELIFSLKRTIEIQQLLDHKVNPHYIIQAISLNNNLLNDIENYFLNTKNTLDNNDNFLDIYDYIFLEKKQMSEIIDKNYDDLLTVPLREMKFRLNDDIDRLLQIAWTTSGSDKKLILSAIDDGTYSIFVKNDPELNMDKSELFFNKNKITLRKISDEFYKGDDLFVSKGNYPIEFKTNTVNLLPATSSTLNLYATELTAKASMPIMSLNDSQSRYLLEFDYKIEEGNTPRVFISSSVNGDNGETLVTKHAIDLVISNPKNNEWNHFKTYFTPLPGNKKTLLNFWLSRQDNGDPSIVDIQNLTLTKVVNPVIVLTKDTGKTIPAPKITFHEINPTDYEVTVQNAKSPFFLSFSEGFDSGWNIYRGWGSADNKNTTTMSYFNGDVKEISSDFTPDVTGLLKTLRKKSEDYQHGEINGFGNGWIITDTGDYTLHIIYRSQAYVLIGTFITCGVLVLIIGGVFFFLVKEIRKK